MGAPHGAAWRDRGCAWTAQGGAAAFHLGLSCHHGGDRSLPFPRRLAAVLEARVGTHAEHTSGHWACSAMEGLVSSLGFVCCGETGWVVGLGGSMCLRACSPGPRTAGALISISFCRSGFDGPKCHQAVSCEKGESSARCSESTSTAQAVTVIWLCMLAA